MHVAALPEAELLRACDVTRTRASGPGGQHRNKVETAIRIKHRATGVTGAASERRSQAENRRVAIFRLRINLAIEVREPPAESTSQTWQKRVHGGRLSINSQHQEFPELLAECLDVLHHFDFELQAALERLAITRSQLARFLGREPRALEWVNRHRAQRSMHPLR